MSDPLEGIPSHLRGMVHADEYGYLARATANEREQYIAALQAKHDAKPKPSDSEVGRNTKAQEGANEILRQAAEKQIKKEKPTGGIRVLAQLPSPTEQEERDSKLLQFMPKQLRAEYEKADPERKAMLWEANRAAFEEAKERKHVRLLAEQVQTQKILDMLQRLREDPSKSHLLPPDDASMEDLRKWYDEMSKPVRLIPFPGEGGYGQQLRVPDIVPKEETLGYRIGRALDQNVAEAERLIQRSKEKIQAREVEESAESPSRKTPSEGFGQKFQRMMDSNLFWGGGIGLAGLAYGFEWAKAPPHLTIAMVAVSWLIICVSIYRHKFFDRWPRLGGFFANLFIFLLIAAALAFLWILFIPPQTP